MIHKIIFVLLILFSTSSLSSDLHSDINLRWMQENYSDIQHHLTNGTKDTVIPEINTLTIIWKKRDGAVSGEVSPLLITALTFHTDMTLAMLASEPASFSKWLNELEGIVFTDFSGDQFKQLSLMKSQLTDALTIYINNNPDDVLKPFATQLLMKLRMVSVHQID